MSTVRFRPFHAAVLAASLLAAPAAHAQQTVRIPEKDRALTFRPTTVYSVGTAEGREYEMFSSVGQVAFDRADNLYVLDMGGRRVVVFDRTGKYVRQFGKEGGGPGEFQAPIGMAVASDGTVTVGDLLSRSFSLFGADGRYRRSVPMPEGFMPAPAQGIAAHPRGGVVAAMRAMPSMDGPRRDVSQQSNPIVWQPFTAGAQPVRLFAPSAEVRTSAQSSGTRGAQRMTFNISVAMFAPRISWGLFPGGEVAVAHTTGYTVKVMRNGQPVRYIQKPMRERRVTERDRERARERRREQLRTGEGTIVIGRGSARVPPAEIEKQVRDMTFAETIPAIQNLRVDRSGRIWVERTGEEWGQPGPIDLLTADGRYVGTVTGQTLPAAFSASGRAAYIEKDDEGVERVVVRQLPRV